jgi:Mrp family chromosome partitioning ATPase
MDIRDLVGRGRLFLEQLRFGERTQHPAGSFSLLALRLERDLPLQSRGRSVLIVAADDDVVGAEATVELGWCLAEELGHSVLLIDGAFGDRALSTALGLAEKPGLAEAIAASLEGGPTIQGLAQPTAHERIFVLAHGTTTDDPVIRAETMQQLMADACRHYGFVLVRGSILVEGVRAMAFSSLVDASLLIAVEERTTVDQITRGQRLLNDCGARRVALVLANRPEVRRQSGR